MKVYAMGFFLFLWKKIIYDFVAQCRKKREIGGKPYVLKNVSNEKIMGYLICNFSGAARSLDLSSDGCYKLCCYYKGSKSNWGNLVVRSIGISLPELSGNTYRHYIILYQIVTATVNHLFSTENSNLIPKNIFHSRNNKNLYPQEKIRKKDQKKNFVASRSWT